MNAEERCGHMREGNDMQCIYSAGHSGLHQWGSVALSPWSFDDAQDGAGDKEGLQAMPQVSGCGGCEIQGE